MTSGNIDLLLFGHRLRFFRKRLGLTLTDLGKVVSKPAPFLSQLENGHVEAKIGLIGDLATALGVTPADLLDPEPPSRRSALELTLRKYQEEPNNIDRKLPQLRPSSKVPDDVLEHVVGLYAAIEAESTAGITREQQSALEAREANVALRAEMKKRNNYFEEIETIAGDILSSVNYAGSGPISEKVLKDICDHFGFTVKRTQGIPNSTRSVTDQRERIIYIPQRNSLPSHLSRSVVLQTLGHYALDHEDTDNFREYLRQRIESNYFSAAILAPEKAAANFLQSAYESHDISVEDLQEIFNISYEMAGHRLTNLATKHLGITLHFLRSDDEGFVWKAYENDEVPLPSSPDGTIEGENLCRNWGTRQAFHSEDSYSLHYQYTDTSNGKFWCVTYVEADRLPHHAVTIGTTADQAKWFRGSETKRTSTSYCPDPVCCTLPRAGIRQHWQGVVWPSARDRSYVVSGLPVAGKGFSKFPGVDMVEVYEFLEQQEST